MGRAEGKTVIVTGASRGIGKAIAELFAAEGANVACVARTVNEGDSRAPGALTTTLDGIRAAGGEAMMVVANIGEEEECLRLVEETRAAYGPIDILVNNAVTNFAHPVSEFPSKRWMIGFSVNIHAPFILARETIPDMQAQGGGAIVNISSGVAIGPGRGPYEKMGWDGMGVLYGSTKAALERFTQGLAAELWGDKIAVSALSPSQAVFHGGCAALQQAPTGPAERARLDDGRGDAAAGDGAARARLGPRLLQPADPAGVRLDRGRPRHGRSTHRARVTRSSRRAPGRRSDGERLGVLAARDVASRIAASRSSLLA